MDALNRHDSNDKDVEASSKSFSMNQNSSMKSPLVVVRPIPSRDGFPSTPPMNTTNESSFHAPPNNSPFQSVDAKLQLPKASRTSSLYGSKGHSFSPSTYSSFSKPMRMEGQKAISNGFNNDHTEDLFFFFDHPSSRGKDIEYHHQSKKKYDSIDSCCHGNRCRIDPSTVGHVDPDERLINHNSDSRRDGERKVPSRFCSSPFEPIICDRSWPTESSGKISPMSVAEIDQWSTPYNHGSTNEGPLTQSTLRLSKSCSSFMDSSDEFVSHVHEMEQRESSRKHWTLREQNLAKRPKHTQF